MAPGRCAHGHRHGGGDGPDELSARAVAQRTGLQDPQIWRALPKGRADILLLVACDLQVRQTDAVKAARAWSRPKAYSEVSFVDPASFFSFRAWLQPLAPPLLFGGNSQIPLLTGVA